jgi:hypothetical protein
MIPAGAPDVRVDSRRRGSDVRYFCHAHPDVLTVVTHVVDARPGRLVLADTPSVTAGRGTLAARRPATSRPGLANAEGRGAT